MRVFVYEAITAGAVFRHQSEAPSKENSNGEGLLVEGLAMLRAVTEDFARIDGIEVWGLRDARLAGWELPRKEALIQSAEEEREELRRVANLCDWALVIAPELDGVLEERVSRLRGTKARLLSPSGEFLTIASSKRRTAERLRKHGLSVPSEVGGPYGGGIPEPPEGETPAVTFPLVYKRDDGAGSAGMRLIESREELKAMPHFISSRFPPAVSAPLREARLSKSSITQRRRDRKENGEGNQAVEYRLEEYCHGLPASVAVLCGPRGNVALQPCEQRLVPNSFEYQGGSTPLLPHLEQRARNLALAALAALPPTTGYVGVDMVLGEDGGGSQDVVIEINPRLTTSYVGLRQACRQNLAQAMLDAACGRHVDLSFRPERVEFQADGKVQKGSSL